MYIILGLILIILLFIYDRKNKSYWLERGIYSPPTRFIFGAMLNPFSKKLFWEAMDENIYKKGKSHKIIGIFELFKPCLVLADLSLIKQILVTDFDHFVDRRTIKVEHPKDQITNSMIINMKGIKWKQTRSVITPIFSSGKIKAMYSLVDKEAQSLTEYCNTAMLDGKSINVMELTGKYSLNVIQSCAFGMEGESFKEKQSEMFHLVNSIFNFTSLTFVKFMCMMTFPKLSAWLGFHFITPAQMKLNQFVKEIIVDRRLNGTTRSDFLSYLIDVEKKSKQLPDGTYIVDDDVIISQTVLFLFAGFETVKNNLAFIIHNLAQHPEEQEKLRDELKQVKTEDGINYQQLQDLHYLDAFISESMRIYPTAFMLERCCTKDYKFPGTDAIIPSGTMVTIPVYSLNKDPEIWDQPEEFRPSRFLKENKNKLNSSLYLPFGLGPRNCVANRFALLEMKIAVAKLLSSFDIKLKRGTSLKIAKSFMAFKPDDKEGIHVILNQI